MRILLVPFVTLVLTGCTSFPELEGTVSPEVMNAPYPELQPVDPILASTLTDPVQLERQTDVSLSRVSRLQARADALRTRDVIPRATRNRMQQAISATPN